MIRFVGEDGRVTEDELIEAVQAWFQDAWDPELSLIEWRSRMVDAGWAMPSWSRDWFGQELPAWADGLAHRTIRAAGGVATPLGSGVALAAPTIYEHGSDELRQRLLRPTLTGELDWCQLFSEPGAGSDLAGLKATAVRDGDQWVINGQKVWNTSADHADMAILVARTDWDVPKHAGITYFILDMRQSGVEVRPIPQMNFHDSFNEVFLSDALVPHSNVVGEIGGGWRVARATLAHERSFATQRSVHIADHAAGRVIEEAREEASRYLKTYEWYPQRAGRFDLLISRAHAMGRTDNPVLRDEIMKVWTFQKAAALTAERARVQRALGKSPGPEGSIGKLALSELSRRCNHAHSSIAGASGLLAGHEGDSSHAAVAETLISTPAQSIAGGTDQVQKNILGENMLGLPKEPSVDRGVPFNQVGKQQP